MGANRHLTATFTVTGDPDEFNPLITAWLAGLAIQGIIYGDDVIISPDGPLGIDPPALNVDENNTATLTMPNFDVEDGTTYRLDHSDDVFMTFVSVADIGPNDVVYDTCNALRQWRIVASSGGVSVPGNPTYRAS